jgi:SAM-dependent methyltransferase
MGASRPHLIVADVEHLPLQSSAVDAVLAYESFHHIPDRRRAMEGYDRVLRPGGRVVFAEPDGRHETSAVAVEAMEKYGILERGMELDDVIGYAAGTRLTRVEQVFVSRLSAADAGREVSPGYLQKRRLFDANVFLLSRGGAAETLAVAHARRGEIWRAAKYHVKRALGLLG